MAGYPDVIARHCSNDDVLVAVRLAALTGQRVSDGCVPLFGKSLSNFVAVVIVSDSTPFNASYPRRPGCRRPMVLNRAFCASSSEL
jgi:hypothetical protein